jgi:hypothetical protein
MSEIVNEFKRRLASEASDHSGRCRGLDVLFQDIDSFLTHYIIAESRITQLEAALRDIKKWTPGSDCYCLTDEEASTPGGKTCPACIAEEALKGKGG